MCGNVKQKSDARKILSKSYLTLIELDNTLFGG